MIKLQTFDNFLKPLRFFRPWIKSRSGREWRRGLSLFSAKMTALANTRALHILTSDNFSFSSRPRLRIKGLHYSTIASICTWKTTVLLTYREAKGKNQQWGKQNIHFLWVAGKRNLQYYVTVLSTMRHAIYTHGCIYIQIFEWHRPIRKYLWADTWKRFFQNIWNHIFQWKVLKYQGISLIWERAEHSSSRLGV